MDLYIESLTGTVFELKVSPFETIKSIKSKIQRAEGIPVNQQHLIWQNSELEDDCSLRDYQISCGATLKLVLDMRGGPINTRRVVLSSSVFSNCSSPSLCSGCSSSEPSSGSNKLNETSDQIPNTHITLLVFKEGDQINFYRVIDNRNDPVITPMIEALPDTSAITDDIGQQPSEKDIDNIIPQNNSSNDELDLRSTNLSRVIEDPGSWLPDWIKILPQPTLLTRRYPSLRLNNLPKNVPQMNKTENVQQEEKLLREKCSLLQKRLEQLKLSKQSKQNKSSILGVKPTSRQMTRNGQLAPLQNRPKLTESSTSHIQNVSQPFKSYIDNENKASLECSSYHPSEERKDSLKYTSRNCSKPFVPFQNKQNISGICQKKSDFDRSSSLGPLNLKKIPDDINNKMLTKRCFLCNKKTGLATSYDCRCEHNFCSRHRYAETHHCTFDYKSDGRQWLKESNPFISASKLPKI